MNLRILKKLCKRAAPLLPLLGDKRHQYKAEKWECYISRLSRCDLKHWERRRTRYPSDRAIKYRPVDGKDWIVMIPPDQPLKGTMMVGSMEGYYEREWEEESAWDALFSLVWWHFAKHHDDEGGGYMVQPRDLRTPSLVLKAAREIIQERKANGGTRWAT